MEIKAYYSKRFLRSKDIFILIPNKKKSNVKNQHAKLLTHRLHCDLILESVESKNASFLRFNCYQNADKKQLPFVTKKDIIGLSSIAELDLLTSEKALLLVEKEIIKILFF